MGPEATGVGPPARAREAEITRARGRLGVLVAELERRSRELIDVRLQVRRHRAAVLTGGALVAVTGVLVAVAAGRRRQRALLARRARPALPAPQDRPEEAPPTALARPPRAVRVEPGFGRRMLTAAMTAVVATLARRLTEAVVQAFVRWWREPGALGPGAPEAEARPPRT